MDKKKITPQLTENLSITENDMIADFKPQNSKAYKDFLRKQREFLAEEAGMIPMKTDTIAKVVRYTRKRTIA